MTPNKGPVEGIRTVGGDGRILSASLTVAIAIPLSAHHDNKVCICASWHHTCQAQHGR